MVFLVSQEVVDDIHLFRLALLGDDIQPLHGTSECDIKQVEVVQTVAFLLFFNLLQSHITHILRVLVQLEKHLLKIGYRVEAQVLRTQPFLSGLAGIQLFVQVDDGIGIDDHGEFQSF